MSIWKITDKTFRLQGPRKTDEEDKRRLYVQESFTIFENFLTNFTKKKSLFRATNTPTEYFYRFISSIDIPNIPDLLLTWQKICTYFLYLSILCHPDKSAEQIITLVCEVPRSLKTPRAPNYGGNWNTKG